MKKTDSKAWDSRLGEIARRVAGLKRDVRGKIVGGVPRDLQEAVVSVWRASGLPRDRVGERIGVTGTSVGNWARRFGGKTGKPTGQGRRIGAKRSAPQPVATSKSAPVAGFREIRIQPSGQGEQRGTGVKATPAGRELRLELGSGAVVRGVTLDELARLLGQMGSLGGAR
jgi:hypothetical protein